jgi:hypothetical protein
VLLFNEMSGLSGSNFIAMFTIVALLSAMYVPRSKKKLGIGHTIQLKNATKNRVVFDSKERNSVYPAGHKELPP